MESGFDDPISLELVPHGVGTVLAERFKLIRYIGAGSVGGGYEAYDSNRSSTLALKIFYPTLVAKSETRESLLRAVKLNSSLNIPSVVCVYETYQDDSLVWFTMELVEGRTLEQMLLERKVTGDLVRTDEVNELMQQLLAILESTSSQTHHFGLKPRNIVIDSDGRLRLMDFGYQMCIERSRASYSSLVLSTVCYQAPEVIQGEEIVDSRADQFSVAAIAYEMLSGVSPQGMGPKLSDLRRDVNRSLEDCLSRALSTRAEDRFSSIAQFAKSLRLSLETMSLPNSIFRGFLLGLVILGLWVAGAFVLPDSSIGRSLRSLFRRDSFSAVLDQATVLWNRTAIQIDRNANEFAATIEWLERDGIALETIKDRRLSEPSTSFLAWLHESTVHEHSDRAMDVLVSARRDLDQGRPEQAINRLERIYETVVNVSDEIGRRRLYMEKAVEARDLAIGLRNLEDDDGILQDWIDLLPGKRADWNQFDSTSMTNLYNYTISCRARAERNLAGSLDAALRSRAAFRVRIGEYSVFPIHLNDPNRLMHEASQLSKASSWGEKKALYVKASQLWERWGEEIEGLPKGDPAMGYENSLGMKFVPIADRISMSIFETRVKIPAQRAGHWFGVYKTPGLSPQRGLSDSVVPTGSVIG